MQKYSANGWSTLTPYFTLFFALSMGEVNIPEVGLVQREQKLGFTWFYVL